MIAAISVRTAGETLGTGLCRIAFVIRWISVRTTGQTLLTGFVLDCISHRFNFCGRRLDFALELLNSILIEGTFNLST